jgi:YD repeat-containing protein
LKKVKGGINAFTSPDWNQSYAYDRYGNKLGVTKTGNAPQIPLDGMGSVSVNAVNNRITSAGFAYDDAGNQTRAVIDGSGTQHQYRYDAAGRLVQVVDGSGATVLASYSYGAGRQRLMSVEGGVTKYYGWGGEGIISEYVAVGASLYCRHLCRRAHRAGTASDV